MSKQVSTEYPLYLERLYAKMGMSYWLGATVTSFVLAGPGFLVFLTGEITVWASYGLLNVYRPLSGFLWLLSFLILQRLLRDRTVAASRVLTDIGCLDDARASSYLREIFVSNRQLLGLLAGIFVTAWFSLGHFVFNTSPYFSFQYAIYVTAGSLVWWSLFGIFVIQIAGCVWLIRRIGSSLQVRTYLIAHKLTCLARLALFAAFSWLFPLSVLIPIMIPEAAPFGLVFPALLALAAIAIVIFLASLYPLHKALAQFKDARLDESLTEFDRLSSLYLSVMKRSTADKTELESLGDQLSVLIQLEARVLKTLKSWSLDFSTVYQISVVSLLPLLTNLFIRLVIGQV